MLPLCTKVTDGSLCLIAYSIAERTKRSVPSLDTGLIPIPEVSGKRIFLTPNSVCKKLIIFLLHQNLLRYSIPA